MQNFKPETNVQNSSLAEIPHIRKDAPAADQRRQTMQKQTRGTNVLAENGRLRLPAQARSA